MRGNFYGSQESGLHDNNNSAIVNERADRSNNGGHTAGGPMHSANRFGGLGNGLQGIREIGGGQTANTYCPSSMCIEIDEFKFYQIAKNIFTNLNFEMKDSKSKADHIKK